MSQRQIIVSFIVISAATMCKFVSIYHLKNEENTIYESSYTTETVYPYYEVFKPFNNY